MIDIHTEREMDQLARMELRVIKLETELAETRCDVARLDYVDAGVTYDGVDAYIHGKKIRCASLREGIDRAMADDPKLKEKEAIQGGSWREVPSTDWRDE